MKTYPNTLTLSTSVFILVLACVFGAVASSAFARGIPPAQAKEVPPGPELKPNETADWYKDEECRMVFFTVLEGLYRDGISQEVVDLVIGRVESNDLERAFVFRCKLCHATYEAFALYQIHGVTSVDDLDERKGASEAVLEARDAGLTVGAWILDDWRQTEGANDRKQLADLGAELNRRIVEG